MYLWQRAWRMEDGVLILLTMLAYQVNHHRMLLLISKHRKSNLNSESGNSESDSSCIILYGDCTELSDILCLWLHLWL